MRAPGESGAAHARAVLAKGSTSFAAAARVLPADRRDDVARLYAWCRHLDDVIDGQTLGHDGAAGKDLRQRLETLTAKSEAAIEGGRCGDPIFDGFGEVAARHGISRALVDDHLDGFEMDVEERTYRTLSDLCGYCYGVAGSVGVMMACVLGVPASERDTLLRASDLGLAFQLTNIARDVVADARVGRLYLPLEWLREVDVPPCAEALADPANAAAVHCLAGRLVEAAEPYYASARVGIARLDYRSGWAIASAATIYRAIGVRRRAMGPQRVGERARTSTLRKAAAVGASAVTVLSRAKANSERAPSLWTPPPRP